MKDYESIALSCEFESVEDTIGEDLGFIWAADMKDEKVVERLAEKNAVILNAELDRWATMDEFLRKKWEDREMREALVQSAKEKAEEDAQIALETTFTSTMESLLLNDGTSGGSEIAGVASKEGLSFKETSDM